MIGRYFPGLSSYKTTRFAYSMDDRFVEEPIKVFFTLVGKQLLVGIEKCVSNYKLLFLSLLINPDTIKHQYYLDADARGSG